MTTKKQRYFACEYQSRMIKAKDADEAEHILNCRSCGYCDHNQPPECDKDGILLED